MESIDSLIEESKAILNTLHTNVSETKKINNQDELRSEISSFVANQMQSISRQDVLRGLIESELAKAILLHELSPSELQSLYTSISSEKAKSTSALLDIFKPTQNTNTLMTPPEKEEEAKGLELTPEQRQGIAKMGNFLEALEERRKEQSGEQ